MKQTLKGLTAKTSLLITASLVGLAVLLFPFTAQTPVTAATSSNLNFQARLQASNGSSVPDGNYHIEFKLYNASTGGSALWTETRTTGNLVRVVNGYLTVNLGSVTAFPTTVDWSEEHWLTMNIGGTAGTASWDGEMNPRLKLTAVPYAFQSAKALTLEKTAGGFTGTVDFGSLSANRKYLFPDTSLATTASPGTICVFNGANSNCPAASGSAFYIQNDTVTQTANFNIQSGADNKIGAIIQGHVSQSVDILQIKTASNTVLAVSNQGLITMTPRGSLTNGQAHVTQTVTVANATASGVVRANKLDVTVANTTAGTTYGHDITVTDNSTSLSQANYGLKVTMVGTNANQNQIGVDSSVSRGMAIMGASSGPGSSQSCAGQSNLAAGVCGQSTSSSQAVGVAGGTGMGGSTVTVIAGTGVYGANSAAGTAGNFYKGLYGRSDQTAAAAYTSVGVLGRADGGAGATLYGGYFTLGTAGATLGSALYASNSTVAANILQLQDNTTDVFRVADGGAVTVTPIITSGTALAVDASNAGANGVSIDVQSNSSSQYALSVTSNNGATTGLYVRADGNVGIGTANPDYKLHVAGTIKTNDLITSGPWADVRAYGAKGDGTTDDTTAIQTAINSGSKAIYLPKGRYRITSTLMFSDKEGMRFYGDGNGQTTNAGSALVWGGAANGTMMTVTSVRWSKFENFQVDGNGTAGVGINWTTSNLVASQQLNTVQQVAVVGVKGTPGRALYVGSSTDADVSQNVFRDMFIGDSTVGIYQEGTNTVQNIYDRSTIMGRTYGIYFHGGEARVERSTFLSYDTVLADVYVKAATLYHANFVNNYHEVGSGYAGNIYDFESGVRNSTTIFQGIRVYSYTSSGKAINYNNTGNVTLTGSSFEGPGHGDVYISNPGGGNATTLFTSGNYIEFPALVSITTAGNVTRHNQDSNYSINSQGTANAITNQLLLSNDLTGANTNTAGTSLRYSSNGGSQLAEIVLQGGGQVNNDTNIVFRTQASAAGGLLDRMTIGYNGNIGINVSSGMSGNLDIRQIVNGDSVIYGRRKTDTTPTGNLVLFQNAAGSTDLFKVDVSGNLTTAGNANIGGSLTAAGNANIGGNVTVTGDVNIVGQDLFFNGVTRMSDSASPSFTYLDPQNATLALLGGDNLTLYNSDNTKTLRLSHNGTAGFIETLNYGGGASPIYFQTNGTTGLVIDTNGRVGLNGNTSPTTGLDVVGVVLNTSANEAVGSARFLHSLTKNDTNTRSFSSALIQPVINTGASNTNTTLNVLDINTVNTSVTGVTTNLIRASYGSAEKFRVDSSGNVIAAGTIQGSSSSYTQGSAIFAGANGMLSQDNANFFFDDTNNRLGIGTNAPGTALEVKVPGTAGAITNTLTLSNGLTGANTTSAGSGILFSSNGGSQLARIAFKGDGQVNNDTGILFQTQASAAGGLQDRMYIDRNGNVGIGTAAPSSLLHVAGSQPLAVAANGTNATQALQITGGKGGNTTGTTGQIAGTGAVLNMTAGAGGDAPAGSTNGNGGSITLQGGAPGAGAGTAGSYGNIVLQSSGGRVGIGTSGTPGALLSIGGTTGNLTVNSSGNLVTSGTLQVTGLGTFNGGLTVATGSTLTNASSTLFTAIAIADKPTGGAIGTAAATVDVATTFTVNQTTAAQTITIPAPTVTTAGRLIYVSNIGTANFTMLGFIVSPGTSVTLVWNGSAWTGAGADGSSILNQKNTDQNANFRISGFGQANTAFISPFFKTADSSGSSNTANVTLQSGDANSGNNNTSGTVTIKSGDGANGSNASSGSITIDAGLKSGAGTAGSISIGTANASALTLGRAGITTTNGGALTVTGAATFSNNLTVNGTDLRLLENGTTPTYYGIFDVGDLSADQTFTFTQGGLVCTDSGNCNGAGASLQTSYNNSQGGTTPEIKLDTTRTAVDIQDADTTLGATTNLLAVRGSNSSGLGSLLFGVQANGNVTAFGTLQGATGAFTNGNSLSLGTASAVGKTGQITFYNSSNNNALILQSGTTNSPGLTFTLPTADGADLTCLKTNGAGVLSFSTCLAGDGTSGGVTQLNSLTGSVTLRGAANQITVAAGSPYIDLTLPQDINTTSTPTFGGLTAGLAPGTLTTVSDNPLSSTATTINVVSTTGYPAGSVSAPGKLFIDSEIVTYTGATATSFTGVTRGAYGTTAATHNSGATVNNYLLSVVSSSTSAPKLVVAGNGNIGINVSSGMSGNLDIRQIVNGDSVIYGRRKTDTTPTGNLVLFQNAAGGADLFKVDISGNLTTAGNANIGGNLTVTGDANIVGQDLFFNGVVRMSDSGSTGFTYIDPQNATLALLGGDNLTLYNSANTKTLRLSHNGTAGFIETLDYGGGASPIYFQTNGQTGLVIDTNSRVGIGGNSSPITSLDVIGLTLNTNANNAVGAARFIHSLTKNDTNVRNFSGTLIQPSINTGVSNANTTLNVLDINTINTATNGVATNLIKASYGGAERFRVDSSGNVIAAGTIQGASSSYTQGSAIFAGANGVLSQDNANFFFDDTNNRLGIGTNAPGTALEVKVPGTVGAITNMLTLSTGLGGADTASAGSGILFSSNSGQQQARIAFKGDGQVNNDTGILFQTQSSMGGGLQDRVYIDRNGNVGIGNTTVGARLDISNATAANTNTGFRLQSTFAPTVGGTQTNANLVVTNVPTTSANTAVGLSMAVNDSTALANTLQGINLTLSDTGSAAKTVRGLFIDTSGTTNASANITAALFKGTTTTNLVIQNSSSTELLRADTTNMVLKIGRTTESPTLGAITRLFTTVAEVSTTLRIGNGTDGVNINTATTNEYFRLSGNARNKKLVNLVPEYAGATMTGSGNGSMTSDFCSNALTVNSSICSTSGDEHNYYSWTSGQGTAQTYNIYVRYQLPSDFDAFVNPTDAIKMFARRTTSSTSVQLAMFRNGSPCGSTVTINTSDNTWQENSGAQAINVGGCTWAANDVATFRVTLSSTSNSFAYAGAIRFDYYSKF